MQVAITRSDKTLGQLLTPLLSDSLLDSSWDICEINENVLADPNQLAILFQGCECVVHLDAYVKDDSPLKEAFALNVAQTENVMAAAHASGVRLVIFVSSTDVTLARTSRVHWDEKKKLPGKPFGYGAQSLLLAEELIQGCALSPWMILRVSYLWGGLAKSPGLTLSRLSSAEYQKGPWLSGSGNQLMSATHIQTLADALTWICVHLLSVTTIMGAQRVSTFHIVDKDHTTSRELFTNMTKQLALPKPRQFPFAFFSKMIRPEGISSAEWIRRTHPSLFDAGAFEHLKMRVALLETKGELK